MSQKPTLVIKTSKVRELYAKWSNQVITPTLCSLRRRLSIQGFMDCLRRRLPLCNFASWQIKNRCDVFLQYRSSGRALSCRLPVKAMLHEAIVLATFCCETSCKKNFTCNTPVLQPATATKCCVASYQKSRNILCATYPLKPARQFCEN